MRTTRFTSCLAMMAFGAMLSGSPARGLAEGAPAKAAVSTSLTFDVAGKVTTLSLADLQALPQRTVAVHNAHTKMDETYTGVELSDLLAKYGAALDKTSQKRMLHSYLRVEGTDHYFVLYSGAEISEAMHNGDVIVATSIDGKGLREDGAMKLVASGDKKAMRWVRNLTKITLITVN